MTGMHGPNSPAEDPQPWTVAGVMTGTSADGVDAVVCRISGAPPNLRVQLVEHRRGELPAGYAALVRNAANQPLTPQTYATLEAYWTRGVLDALAPLHREHGLHLAGLHGQTIWHLPSPASPPLTHQVANPYPITQALGIEAVWDFRRADMAANGQGAPLMPYAHWLLWGATYGRDTGVLNLGGIANLTLLDREATAVQAWDTGPGMMLLDALARTHLSRAYDRDGRTAAEGNVSEALAAVMLDHQYFRQKPPKSTGRELFGDSFYNRFETTADRLRLAPADRLRTAAEITVRPVAEGLPTHVRRLIVCGGGAENQTVLAALQARCPEMEILRSSALGVPVDAVEGLGFALLAYERIHKRPGNLPAVTGAAAAVPLGAVAPVGAGSGGR